MIRKDIRKDDPPFDEELTPAEIANVDCSSPLEATFGEDNISRSELEHHQDNDQQIQRLKKILKGELKWSDDTSLKAEYRRWSEDLHENHGILMRFGQAVIPTGLRLKTLRLAHRAHLGVSKTKSILKDRVWWPGMGTDVERVIRKCRTCILISKKVDHEPMRRSELPTEV